jgi:predicted negative regulator of RcsB-dependent stress response
VQVYTTEDEQVEAIKRWFRDYGRQIVTGMLIAAVAAFGVYSWKQRQLHQRAAASAEYQNLLQAVQQADTNPSKETLTTARHFADSLKNDFAGTAYAQFAALFKAKLAVQENDLTQAESELRWVLERKPSADIKALTQLRLARVLLAKGDAAAALALLDETGAGGYAAAYAQLKGDIALSKGDSNQARSEFERAQALERKMSAPINDPLLEMKLRDLQPAAKKEQGAG